MAEGIIKNTKYADIIAINNDYTSWADLISNTSSNPYTAPRDGYVFAKALNGTGRIRLYDKLAIDIPSGLWYSCPVKKGGHIYKEENISNIVFAAFW